VAERRRPVEWVGSTVGEEAKPTAAIAVDAIARKKAGGGKERGSSMVRWQAGFCSTAGRCIRD